ncbi:MAG: nitrate reductase [Gammaproteobacteria bacterium HGW-Gammaproteobacteria-14]|nr:MAG: nitrate reductase [Gammaproteobacteria bacterium HGW-Gammaproteobacteria-14]
MNKSTDPQHIEVNGDTLHPANFGRLCVKGSALGDTIGLQERLLHPHIGDQRVSWDRALDATSAQLQRIIREHGPDAVAFYVSGQLLTEDYYVANKLMKGFIGSANIDTNSRLCMSTAVAAHKRILGSDTVPGCYEDLELADLIVITGSNMAWTHPVIYQRIVAAKAARPQMRIVVIDPRRTATAEIADLHLPITPGSDGYLFDGLLASLVQNLAVDTDFVLSHTDDFVSTARSSCERSGTTADIAARCGIETSTLNTFFQWFANTERTVTVFSQGINQSASGVDKASAILHCHLATGRIGKPGATPFSITGQPNAMGGREVGGLANQLAAHMDIENPDHRDLVRRFWNAPAVAEKSGLKAVSLFDAIAEGQVKFVWIMATNPAVSLPEADKVREALRHCECVVVSDCVADTDTLRLAHIRLPAAGWGEKDGTVTNSERRISRQRAFLPLPGEAKPDWWAITEVARRLGFADHFDYQCAADIFREHAALSCFENNGRRDFDIGALSSISNDDYDSLVPVQWPFPSHSPDGTSRLFGNGHFFTTNGRARFIDSAPQPAASQCSNDWPLMLNTGRIRDQWHTMTRTGRSARLLQHIAEPFIELHPQDMQTLRITNDQLVRVRSPQGHCVVRARRQEGQSVGTAFMPIHWNDCFASDARVDALVAAQCDPISGQPAFKQTPVAVSALQPRWQAVLISRGALTLPDHDYWCRRPTGDWQIWDLAGSHRPAIADLKSHWAAHADQWAELEDSDAQSLRLIGYRNGVVQCWFSLQPQRPVVDETWLLPALESNAISALLLSRGIPASGGDRSALVCSCHQVREAKIRQAIDGGCNTVESIGATTRAGTNCGSCIPELRTLLSHTHAKEALC